MGKTGKRWFLEHATDLIHDADGALFADHDKDRMRGFRAIRSNEAQDAILGGFKPCHCVAYEGFKPEPSRG